ncbi:PTS sugar transporter subunit IIA [Tessaracoccus antarcticus]|uniref:PTS sugar transporter subunit IIA n=1 Tax=Tessaracoccus antarcticus TaxID=2479848 RepID=UPI00389AA4A6
MSDDVLTRDSIRLGLSATDKDEAIRMCGAALLEAGAIAPPYADAMFDREREVSTYLGEGFAIPHGTNESRQFINRAALGFLQFPEGVDWDGDTVYVCIPIASNSDEHIGILGALAEVLMEPESAEKLRTTTSVDEVIALLSAIGEEE